MPSRRFPPPWSVEELDAPEGGAQAGLILLQSGSGPRPSEFIWEVFTMSHAKQASKRRSRTKAATVLRVAAALSLAGDASAAIVGPAEDIPTENTAPVITLGEEEISDVSLATFYVFDKENAGAHHPGLQLARGRGGRRGCAVHRSCGGWAATGCGGCGGCAACASSGGPDGM